MLLYNVKIKEEKSFHERFNDVILPLCEIMKIIPPMISDRMYNPSTKKSRYIQNKDIILIERKIRKLNKNGTNPSNRLE